MPEVVLLGESEIVHVTILDDAHKHAHYRAIGGGYFKK